MLFIVRPEKTPNSKTKPDEGMRPLVVKQYCSGSWPISGQRIELLNSSYESLCCFCSKFAYKIPCCKQCGTASAFTFLQVSTVSTKIATIMQTLLKASTTPRFLLTDIFFFSFSYLGIFICFDLSTLYCCCFFALLVCLFSQFVLEAFVECHGAGVGGIRHTGA